jgi:hypothetical protein
MYYGLLGLAGKAAGSAYGALTTAWIAATGETDLTILGALNTLESDLTTYGLTSKMKALYPFVGGTATKHKFNFMDARDLDAAYRLVFNGGWVHGSTGSTPNNVNAFADTKLVPSTSVFTNNQNIHLSFYSRTNDVDVGYDVAASYDATGSKFGLITKYGGTNTAYAFYGAFVSASNSDARGFYTSASSPSGVRIIKNGTVLNTGGVASVNLSSFTTESIYISAENRMGTATEFSSKECALATIGTALTNAEAANLYTAVQAFQTTLSRQV